VLTRTAHGYALPEHVAAASDARRARADAVVAALAAEPFAPPDLDEVTRTHGLDHRERAALVASGAVVRCGKVAFARWVALAWRSSITTVIASQARRSRRRN
jgi:hypothetical protein